ncbi:DUF1285 domain-containing protein [Candidatus Binatia bacterium]|nr:DUF1285 domain-containing protein [Candidatus Binatia bacterium]
MPGAGFYSIHTAKLRFGADGIWYADDEPVTHPRLARLFSRYVRRKPDGGSYEVWIDERYHADVEVSDTPFVVTAVETDPEGRIWIDLNDGTTELLDAASVAVGRDNVLYCMVKNGSERARFLRAAYYHLAGAIEEVAAGDLRLRCGETKHPIGRI